MSKAKIFSGALALAMGLSFAMPMRASADVWDHHQDHHHEWRWHWEKDHSRAYRYENPYAYGNRSVPTNGEGMINQRNPNLYWACDSDGHHCHWARR